MRRAFPVLERASFPIFDYNGCDLLCKERDDCHYGDQAWDAPNDCDQEKDGRVFTSFVSQVLRERVRGKVVLNPFISIVFVVMIE